MQSGAARSMVLILDGNSEHMRTHEVKIGLFEEKNPIWGCFRSNQMPYTDQITEINSHVHILFLSYHHL